MLKDILLKTAQLINRDDLIEGLNKNLEDNTQAIKNDIIRLISYFNFTMENLCENYFNLTNTQEILSHNNKLNYLCFTYNPSKIIKITKNGKPIYFSTYSKFISVPEDNTLYKVTYKYLPDNVSNLSEDIKFPKGITDRLICYGIASEFLASKNKPSQAEYWNNKFMFEIFKSKTSQDRKIKQTFTI